MLRAFRFSISTAIVFGMSQLGSVTGFVVDSLGKPLPGVTVLMECPRCETPVAESTTGQDGGYVLSNIQPGTYSLRFRASGLGERVRNVTVRGPECQLALGERVSVLIVRPRELIVTICRTCCACFGYPVRRGLTSLKTSLAKQERSRGRS